MAAQARVSSKSDRATFLLEKGCCAACVLRFSGIRYPDSYLNPRATLAAEFGLEHEATGRICEICLDILGSVCENDFAQRVVDAVQSGGYIYSSFSLCATTPIQVLVRSHAFWQYASTQEAGLFGDHSYDMAVPQVKDVLKWSCGAKLARLLDKPLIKVGGLEVTIEFESCATDELGFLERMDPRRFGMSKVNRGKWKKAAVTGRKPTLMAVEASLAEAGNRLLEFFPWPSTVYPACRCEFPQIRLLHEPVFVAGRYLKFSRDLSQTPWLIDGMRRSASSVEELLTNELAKEFGADSSKFVASGREDIDVRMLGNGRPFSCELQNPHVATLARETIAQIQSHVNRPADTEPLVGVRDLRVVSKKACDVLKEGEQTKTKTYCCIVWLSKEFSDKELCKLDEIRNLVVSQLTPIRVLHRRNLAARPRTIHWMKHKRIAPNYVKLWLNTQAGTYIKEFIHSDFGRTTPHIGSIMGCAADILSLDVCCVHLEWPPVLDT